MKKNEYALFNSFFSTLKRKTHSKYLPSIAYFENKDLKNW